MFVVITLRSILKRILFFPAHLLCLDKGVTDGNSRVRKQIQNKVFAQQFVVDTISLAGRPHRSNRPRPGSNQEFFGQRALASFVKTSHRAGERIENRVASLVVDSRKVARLKKAFACPVRLGSMPEIGCEERTLIQDVNEILRSLPLLPSRIHIVIQQVDLFLAPAESNFISQRIDQPGHTFLLVRMVHVVVEYAILRIIGREK